MNSAEREQETATVLRLDESRCEQAVSVFVDAFDDDPWARHLFRGNQRAFERDVGNVYRALMSVRFARDEPVLGVQIGDRLVGTATLEEPGRPTSFADSFRSLQCARAAVTLLLESGVAASRRMFAYDAAVVARRPHVPHFYLLGIAVIRTEQGNGYGGMLLDAIHSIVEAEQGAAGIALDTATAEDVSLYKHFGYQTTEVADVGGIDMTFMFRPNPWGTECPT